VSASGLILSCDTKAGEAIILTTATVISPFVVISRGDSSSTGLVKVVATRFAIRFSCCVHFVVARGYCD
jgi:hypothetical protein